MVVAAFVAPFLLPATARFVGTAARLPDKPALKIRLEPERAKPIPVLSDVGPLAKGLQDRAAEAAPPIAVAALALLVLALTSGGFLLVATRGTGAWKS